MTFRELYFKLQKENNNYINKEVIEEFLCFIGKFQSKTELFLHFDDNIQNKSLDKSLDKLLRNYPIQYITNCAYFLGDTFFVNECVLIPRQETEQLVIDTIQFINKIFGKNKISGIDIGTGSGIIGISLNKRCNISMTMIDVSLDALKVARINAEKYKIDCNILKSDILKDVPNGQKYDLIISNPPYIEDIGTIDKQVYDYEPHIALLSKPNTYFYEEIMNQSKMHLNEKYIIAFEIEEDMRDKLEELCKRNFPNAEIFFKNDIYNRLRFLYIIKK